MSKPRGKKRSPPMATHKYSHDVIRRAVAATFGIPSAGLGNMDSPNVPRNILWYLLHRLTRLSFANIAELYGLNEGTVGVTVRRLRTVIYNHVNPHPDQKDTLQKVQAVRQWLKQFHKRPPRF